MRALMSQIIAAMGMSLVALWVPGMAHAQDAIFLDPDVEYIPDVSDSGLEDLSDEDRAELERHFDADLSVTTPEDGQHAIVRPSALVEPTTAGSKGEAAPERHY